MGNQENVRKYREAREALNAYETTTEDETYLRLNNAVIEAEKDVTWTQQLKVELGLKW